MGKKMKLPLLLKPTHHPKSSWLWRSCAQPRTLSFRNDEIFRTINSAYLDAAAEAETPRAGTSDDQIEALVRGLRRGERLLLQLEETSSIMEAAGKGRFRLGESVALAMDSKDPYLDFKKSMEEMVEALGLKDWKGMEELLRWYLEANGRSNHEYIIGAFVDLLVGFALVSMNSSGCCCSCNSPSSSSTVLSSSFASSSSSFGTATPCISLGEIEEIECASTTPCLATTNQNQQ